MDVSDHKRATFAQIVPHVEDGPAQNPRVERWHR